MVKKKTKKNKKKKPLLRKSRNTIAFMDRVIRQDYLKSTFKSKGSQIKQLNGISIFIVMQKTPKNFKVPK